MEKEDVIGALVFVLPVMLGGLMLFAPRFYRKMWMAQSRLLPKLSKFNPFMSSEFIESSWFSILSAAGGIMLIAFGSVAIWLFCTGQA